MLVIIISFKTCLGEESVLTICLQAEISCLENAGRLPASLYHGATMYTTLSPCDMCTGACVMYKVKRVVIGENKNFLGGEEYLKQKGIEVVVLHNKDLQALMKKFIKEHPEEWSVQPNAGRGERGGSCWTTR